MGTYNGFWHITCGTVVSKIPPSKSALVPIDERVLGTFPFANELDAPVLDFTATMPLAFLLAALRAIP